MDLFNTKTRNVKDNVYRNITSFPEANDLFAEITQGDPLLNQVAIYSEIEAKREFPPGDHQSRFSIFNRLSF